MEAIFPISDLQKNAAEVKAAAQHDIVRITEKGRGAYIFASEQAFLDRIAREREDAAWEQKLFDAVEEGIQQIENGEYYVIESMEDYDRMIAGDLPMGERTESTDEDDSKPSMPELEAPEPLEEVA